MTFSIVARCANTDQFGLAIASSSLAMVGLLIVDEQDWPYAELRCDWTEACPITAITRTWEPYKPQGDNYVTRALDPIAAPSYGVPVDE